MPGYPCHQAGHFSEATRPKEYSNALWNPFSLSGHLMLPAPATPCGSILLDNHPSPDACSGRQACGFPGIGPGVARARHPRKQILVTGSPPKLHFAAMTDVAVNSDPVIILPGERVWSDTITPHTITGRGCSRTRGRMCHSIIQRHPNLLSFPDCRYWTARALTGTIFG